MEINITGQQVELTPALRSYVDEKLGKIARYLDDVLKIHVVLKVEKNHVDGDEHPKNAAQYGKVRHIAHADLHARGHDLYAKAEAADMYAAIDLLSEKLLQQARKLKE